MIYSRPSPSTITHRHLPPKQVSVADNQNKRLRLFFRAILLGKENSVNAVCNGFFFFFFSGCLKASPSLDSLYPEQIEPFVQVMAHGTIWGLGVWWRFREVKYVYLYIFISNYDKLKLRYFWTSFDGVPYNRFGFIICFIS